MSRALEIISNGGIKQACWILLFNHYKHISTNTAYDHQTWLCVDLPWRASTHEVAWLFNQVFLRNHVTLKPVYLRYHNTYVHQTL